MTQPRAAKLTVNLDIEGASLEIGQLAWSSDDKLAAFEYSRSALEFRIAISPFKARLAQGVIMAPRSSFEGLHGVSADSLPDGWGRLLVDRRAPGPQHFAIIAEKAEIPKDTANFIIDQVTEALASWRSHADGSGIGIAETSAIAMLIDSHAKPALGKKGSIVKDGHWFKSASTPKDWR